MELTEDQKFTICVMAGVDTVVAQRPDGSFHRRTRNPCAVVWDGCGYKVYVGRPTD